MQYGGQEVWSKMNAAALRDMAIAGGGAYIPAGTKMIDLGQLLYEDRIAQEERREFEAGRVELRHVQYQWFAAVALLLLLIETWMSDRKVQAAEQGSTAEERRRDGADQINARDRRNHPMDSARLAGRVDRRWGFGQGACRGPVGAIAGGEAIRQ